MAHTIRVLVVDASTKDIADLRKKMGDAKNVSCVMHSAGTVAEAFQLLTEKRFDVLLIDLTTPGSEGMATLKELQSRTPETPILVISSQHEETESLEAVRNGAQDYLLKSRVNTAAIERILLHCIERQRAKTRTQLQYLVSRILTEADTQEAANTQILKILCEFLEYDFGQVWLFDHWSAELLAAESWPVSTEKYADFKRCNAATRLERNHDVPNLVWEEGKPIAIADLGRAPEFGRLAAANRGQLRSELAFPITLRAEVLGVIELFSQEVREADEELLTAVVNIGTQLGQFAARKRAEEERERLTKERVLLLDCASEGIYGLGLNGGITFMNRAAARMFRCDAYGVCGKNPHELFHHTRPDGTSYPSEACPEQHVLKTGEGARLDHEYFWRTDGSHFSVDYSVFPVIESGTIRGAVVCFSDISDRRQMEIELRHAQKLEAVGGLAAGIAHEINTPIQFVGDNTRFLQDSFRDEIEMLAKYEQIAAEAESGAVRSETLRAVKEVCQRIDWKFLKEEIPKAMDQMLDGVARVANIVRAMKEFSHVDRSSEKAPSDLNKALESTLIVARSELKYVAEVETEFGKVPPVVCHLGDLNQVFLNLLINAAHAIGEVVKESGQRGRVVVRTRKMGDQVEISVSDSGCGIPEAVQQKIFDPFFTTKEVGKGTGQGLTLARAIVVEKHGGTLTFETEVGRGTTFFVRLPIDSAREPREAVAR
jgi:PAS domain S-box-containing protein